MKPLLVAALCAALYYSHRRAGEAQLFENPYKYFSPMEFDTALRGGFNLSDCFLELLNCMELVKPDVICYKTLRFESVCSAMNNDHCRDDTLFGNPPSWDYKALYESFCVRDDATFTL